MCKHGLFIVICIVLCISTGLAAISFIIPREPLSMDVADIDLDGNFDVVIGHEGVATPGHTYPAITLLRNFHNNTFTSIDTSYAYPAYIESIKFAKMNEDNYPDLVVWYNGYSVPNYLAYMRVFFNDNGSIGNPTDFLLTNITNTGYFRFVCADVNGDGLDDGFFVSNPNHLWTSTINSGNNTFSNPISDYLSFPPQAVTSGDLTGDGVDDILVSGHPLTMFSYENNIWTSAVIDSVNHISDSVICDMDNDGENEIVTYLIPLAGDDCVLTIYDKQNGQYVIMYQHIYSFVSSLAVFDYNNDGLPDLLLFNKLITNLGNLTFSEPNILPFATAGNKNVFADMDHNGYLDILSFITDYPSYITRFYIYFNDGNGNFLPDPIVENNDNHNEPIPQIQLSCYPNPFNTYVKNSFTLPQGCHKGTLQIFNLKGEIVRKISLVNDRNEVEWDGSDSMQRAVSPGIYFIRIVASNNQTHTKKILKLK